VWGGAAAPQHVRESASHSAQRESGARASAAGSSLRAVLEAAVGEAAGQGG